MGIIIKLISFLIKYVWKEIMESIVRFDNLINCERKLT